MVVYKVEWKILGLVLIWILHLTQTAFYDVVLHFDSQSTYFRKSELCFVAQCSDAATSSHQ